MKTGDLIKKNLQVGKLNLYEDVEDGGTSYENGESLLPNESGLILQTYHGTGNHTYHKILTPRGTTGWCHEFHIQVIR